MSGKRLYEHWEALVESQSGALALHDLQTGRRWTFGELAAAVTRLSPAGSVVFPKSQGSDFILETLRGWRDGSIVCPVEYSPLPEELFREAPPEIVHAKPGPGSLANDVSLFTAEQLAADARQIVQAMSLRPDWPNLGVISMAHSYGFSNLVLPLLLHGIPLIWVGDSLPGAVGRALTLAAEVTLPAVPLLWRLWADAGVLTGQIKLAICAGAPLNLELEREIFQRHGLKLHNFYGARECGGIAWDPSNEPREQPGSLGKLLPGVRASGVAGVGLWVEGAAVGESWWPSSRPEVLSSGRCLIPDDVVVSDGSLIMNSPRIDLINMAGRKIDPASIEQALEAVEGVEFAIAFGSATPGRPEMGEQIHACLELSEGTNLTQVQASIRAGIHGRESPRSVHAFEDVAEEHPSSRSREAWRGWFRANPPSRRRTSLPVMP